MVTLNNVQNVALINAAGRTVLPTKNAISQTFSEMAEKGIIPGGEVFDLTNSQSTFAWPIVVSGWLWLDAISTLSTCAAKKDVLSFVLWLYTSSVVAAVGEAANTYMLPALYLEQSGLIAAIKSKIMC